MKEKRILILSFYYPPDLSAGSFRTKALVTALLQKELPGVKIDVITTMPNRYNTFDSLAPKQEHTGQLSVQRINLPPHKSGMVDQAKAFLHFARRVCGLTNNKQYDLIYATSSRLMTATLGAWVAKQSNTRLYLDIRDIFVDTLPDILPKTLVSVLKPFFKWIEWWTINRAQCVNLVSQGFETYFKSYYPKQVFSYFMNGIDTEFLQKEKTMCHASESRHPGDVIQILYAGNVGEGQGLHIILPSLAQSLQGRATFKLIGDGGRRTHLEAALKVSGVNNVELMAPMPREALIKKYLIADILFLHLNNYKAFKKVLPSKIFEYAALGKPIWAGVSGYAAQFLKEEVKNVAIFQPCNLKEALQVFEQLNICDTPREEFVQKFSRTTIMSSMVKDILGFL